MDKQNEFLSPIEAAVLIGFKSNTAKMKKYRDMMIQQFGNNSNGVISRTSVESFLDNHVPLSKLRDKVVSIGSVKEHSFTSKYKSVFKAINVNPIDLSNKLECIYLMKDDYDKCLEYYKKIANSPDSKLYYKAEITAALGLKITRKIDEILNLYGIEPYIESERASYYREMQIEKLKQIQMEELATFNEHYVSIEEVANKINQNKATIISWINKNDVQTILPPAIAKIIIGDIDYTSSKKYIAKDLAEKYIKDVRLKREIENVFDRYDIYLDGFKTYQKLMKVYGYEFFPSGQLTEEYWNRFIRKKIVESRVSNMKSFIHQLVLASGLLVNVVNASKKELFNFSTKEINLSLMNTSVPYKYKEKYYSFIYSIQQDLFRKKAPKIFDLLNITNPKKERRQNHVPKEKTIYKPEIFVALFDYCKNLDTHKKKAIADAKHYRQDDYCMYAKMWLYVILHLNNCWRHSDIVDFPRLEGMYQGKNLDWLMSNKISMEEASVIAAYYESKSYIHSKNNEPRHFIMADDLKESFATAVLICEFIQREYGDQVVYQNDQEGRSLIDFNRANNDPSQATHNMFFSNFKYNIKFENRKMNWTVITLATEVIRQLTGRNPLEIARFLRNHSTDEITNIYIQIPQEYVDYIAKQLFNLGSFGYIYDAMAQILFNKNTAPYDFEGAVVIREVFGSPEVIEGISKYLVAMKEERDFVINVLRETSKDEIQEKRIFMSAGLLPSKTVEYECLVGVSNCPKDTQDCDRCNLSIPNRFAVCKVGIDIHQTINEIEEKYNKTPHVAEKVRLASRLYTHRELLSKAINKFGRETVNQLIPGGLDFINERMAMIPKTKEMVSKSVKIQLKVEGISIEL